ncbi:MAG: DUF1587 domain-containing protein, partial [Verrucomicrobiales bacterium]|nr:DUF1587 domain-containing protein [Verrucomicrobiales bacterium]
MPNFSNIFAAVILLMTGWCWNLQAADGGATLALFQQSCIKCHGQDGKVKGKLNLLNIKTAAQLSGDLERLQTILEVLDTSEMPPEKEPPLKPETRAAAVADLQKLLRVATAEAGFAPTPIRRINRLQYNNAVQDLLGLKVSVFPLPEKMMRDRSGYFAKALGPQKKMPDSVTVSSRPLGKSGLIEPRLAGVGPFPQDPRAEHGFDNRGDHLSLSPFLLEAFFKLSRRIVQSPNFDGRTVGIWKEFFVAPPTAPAGDVKDAVRTRLRKFMTRAFRRPVPEALLNRYTQHVHRQIDSGMGFTEA